MVAFPGCGIAALTPLAAGPSPVVTVVLFLGST